MAFDPVNFEEGKVVLVAAANSTTITKGDALVDNGSGLLTTASSSTAVDVPYVAAETVTTTSSGQLVRCIPTRGIRFRVGCDAAPAQTDVGTLCDLATAGTVNPDASSNDLFYIESIDLTDGAVGTSDIVFGYFQHANET